MPSTFSPADERELAELVRERAAAAKPLRIVGGGTKLDLGDNQNQLRELDQLSTSNLSGIELYEPEALTLVVRAGTPLGEVEAALAKENQHLAFEPPDYSAITGTSGDATIGGLVACGMSGPRRIQVGACRDALIGVRFVTGEGTIIKNGGRVMKNVTGYDLVKLMNSAHGTLGVLTQLSFKLLPLPKVTQTLRLSGLDNHQAVKAMTTAMASPFDVSGAAHIPNFDPKLDVGRAATFLRLEGFEESVSYRMFALKAHVIDKLDGPAEFAAIESNEENHSLWRSIRDVEPIARHPGSIWRISVKPTAAPKLVEDLQNSMSADVTFDWSGGLVWLASNDMTETQAHRLRELVNEIGGHATLLRRAELSQDVRSFHPQSAIIENLGASLRDKFDPARILNPGIMGR